MSSLFKLLISVLFIVFVASIIGFFNNVIYLSSVGLYFSLIALILTFSINHISKRKSSYLLGVYVLALIILLNSINFYQVWVESIIHFDIRNYKPIIKMVLTLLTLSLVIILCKKGSILKSSDWRILVVMILFVMALIILQAPIYSVHLDFYGNRHGHSFFYENHLH